MSATKKFIDVYNGGIQANKDPELKRAFDFSESVVLDKIRKPENIRLSQDKLRLSGDGIFFTVQGEGITMGEPVVFIRLHLCNLRCTWCDAYYTWNPKSEAFWTESYLLTPAQVKQKLEDAWKCENVYKHKRCVITGGEPLLQKDKIDKVMCLMPNWKFEIETNGTIMPTEKQLAECQFNCSPKLSNSGNQKSVRIRPEVISALNMANTQFKFVVMNNLDLDEIENEFVTPMKLDINKIVLMPQGVTEKEIRSNMTKVVESAKIKGYKLLGRLHVSIWGAKRKV